MTESKPSPLTQAADLFEKLGREYVYAALYVPNRIIDRVFELMNYKSNHRFRKSDKKIVIKRPQIKEPPAYIVMNYVFPVIALMILAGTVLYTAAFSYGISVEVDGADVGTVDRYSDYGKARSFVAEKAVKYETEGAPLFKRTRLRVKKLSSRDELTDSYGLTERMEEQLALTFPEVSGAEEDIEDTPDFEELIADENDPDVIPAIAVKAGGVIVGFVKSYDEIEAALEEMRSVCYDMEGVDRNKVFFDKDITFEPYKINYHAIIDQSKVIKVLSGNSSKKKTYEVIDGDFPILIADKLGMDPEELMDCRAVYNGREVSLRDSSIHTGTLIELRSDEPFLTVHYALDTSYENVISYSTIKVDDSTVLIGQTETETEGADGLEKITSEITYEVVKDENGVLTSNEIKRKIVGREITKPPVSEIIHVGTLIPDAPWGTRPGSGEYFWPVEGGYISSQFGGDRNHKGLDIAAPLGTPIYAAAPGVVMTSRMGENGGYGNYVIIQNNDGNVTYYAHQSELNCDEGEIVEAGQVIGYVGSTGDSTGPHLHFEVRTPDGYMMDPEDFVSQD